MFKKRKKKAQLLLIFIMFLKTFYCHLLSVSGTTQGKTEMKTT